MTIFCQIRKKQVPATPEERVRQGCILWMIQELGYPASVIGVEKAIKDLPHLSTFDYKLPNRRLDILVYPQGKPLLLIECKAEKLSHKALSQVMGYAHLIGASYIALASISEIKSGFVNPEGIPELQNGLPHYQEIAHFI